MGAVHIRGVSKSYPIYARPADRLKELLTGNSRSYHRDFWALRDISLEIPKGTTFGLVGQNGSGKSTLLQLIAGILKPTRGEVAVEGRVSALLELGSGFNPEFTGRENVFLSGALLGMKRDEIRRLEAIDLGLYKPGVSKLAAQAGGRSPRQKGEKRRK